MCVRCICLVSDLDGLLALRTTTLLPPTSACFASPLLSTPLSLSKYGENLICEAVIAYLSLHTLSTSYSSVGRFFSSVQLTYAPWCRLYYGCCVFVSECRMWMWTNDRAAIGFPFTVVYTPLMWAHAVPRLYPAPVTVDNISLTHTHTHTNTMSLTCEREATQTDDKPTPRGVPTGHMHQTHVTENGPRTNIACVCLWRVLEEQHKQRKNRIMAVPLVYVVSASNQWRHLQVNSLITRFDS